MNRLQKKQTVQTSFVLLWSVLRFQAGFINAFGFLACGRYVSHVTGFGTQIGIAIANAHPLFAIELLGFPIAFILGAFFSGIMTTARLERGKRPYFEWVTAPLPILLVALIPLGKNGLFGPFGEQLVQGYDFLLLFALTFVCGMQNAWVATLTHGQVRTTHLTGISTDIGIDLARIGFGQLDPVEQTLTRKIVVARIGALISFASGSVLSVLMGQQLEYAALVVPLTTSLIIFFAMLWLELKSKSALPD